MEHVLAAQGLRMIYLCDPRTIDELDQDRILDDLAEDGDGDPLRWLTRSHIAEYDHIVLVADRVSGCHLGFLAGTERATTHEEFLLLETAFVKPSARGQNLMRRMIALAMLRIGAWRPAPSIIAACIRDPVCYRIIHAMARQFTNATFYPDRESVAINLHTTALARRIARELGPSYRFQATTGTICGGVLMAAGAGDDRRIDTDDRWLQPADRMLALLDLRGQDEAAILDDALKLYRSR